MNEVPYFILSRCCCCCCLVPFLPSFFFLLRMMFWLSSRLHVIVGCGVPSALQIRVALWFSRTLTVDGELSTSMMLGGTVQEQEKTMEITVWIIVQSNLVLTYSSGQAIFARYNRVNLCPKMTNLTLKPVGSNRVFVNNQIRHNRVSLWLRREQTSSSGYNLWCTTKCQCKLFKQVIEVLLFELLRMSAIRVYFKVISLHICWGQNTFVQMIRPKLGLTLSTKGIVPHSD